MVYNQMEDDELGWVEAGLALHEGMKVKQFNSKFKALVHDARGMHEIMEEVHSLMVMLDGI